MFTTFVVQPIFNILTLIYALLPGHNFGVAIILFTILVRFALFPMLKKQLRHTKAMRDLQPEIKKIKEKTKGNKTLQSQMTMELYKEREIKPMAYIGLMILQIVIFLALFSGLNRIVKDPQEIYNFSYPFVQNLPSMQELNSNPTLFDNTLAGVIDLGRAAIGDQGFYMPAFLLVLGSALIQFVQIRQTMPSQKDSRKLREILRDANSGKTADNAEINAAMGRNMSYVLPVFIFVVTIGFPAALSLYWFVGGLIAYLQQAYLLKQDEYSLDQISATVVSKKSLKDSKKAAKTEPKAVAIAEPKIDDKKLDRKNAPVKVTTSSEKSIPKQTLKKNKSSKNRKRKRR
jgi:YidC/Oxa1 family membrane protein insertase